jgi:hypothetical protein
MEFMYLTSFLQETADFFSEPNAYRSLLILACSIAFAFWMSRLLAKLIIRIAQSIAIRADRTSDAVKQIHLRRVETYLSVSIAAVRVIVVIVVGYTVWKVLSPAASTQAAAIGASALFIVLAGGTIGVMLRDITAGATMIVEHWFNIGDYIRVEPFIDVSGVVERTTLRSIKIRSLNGEIIRIHNQHIHGVKVTPHGVRTIAVDVFVNNPDVGNKLIKDALGSIPVGTLMIAKKSKIKATEQWGDNLWRIMVYCYTAPGREWLIEQYFVDTLKSLDKKYRGKSILVHEPIVRYADPEAERNFKRAIRVTKDD